MTVHGNNAEAGIGLIEILVTIMVLSIGFLAAATMQLQSMRNNHEAYNRSQAYFLATDMIDRMRSNVQGVIDGDYSGRSTSASARDPGCNASSCTPTQIADHDFFHWSSRLHDLNDTQGFVSALPSGISPATGQVVDLNDGLFAVRMSWKEYIANEASDQLLSLTFAVEVPE